jgi:heterotetrameric sarcosine oxidase gamma subunit
MILNTKCNLPYSTELMPPPGSQQDLLETVREQVGMAALAQVGLLNVHGRDGEAVLQRVYALPSLHVGDVAAVDSGLAVRLRRDEFLLVVADVQAAMERVAGARQEARVTLTDITHGRTGIALAGARARDVLAKVCGLDFSDTAFPNMHAAQTSLAKVRVLIIRTDSVAVYQLFVDRSLSAYVWEVVCDAAQEFGGVVLSFDSLRKL